MNSIYKFQLRTDYNGVANNYAVNPLRGADVSKDYEIQQNEMFYRAKLNGKLIFSRADYSIIAGARFETKFTLIVSISYDNGTTWTEYWRGAFWKTDCAFDIDAMTVEVTPAPVDDYTDVLAGLEKEYNLIDLKPQIENLTITKRPLIQMYVPGETVVSCFLSGMYWEQDCEAVTDEDALVRTYHFALNSSRAGGQQVSGTGIADGMWLNGQSPDGLYNWTYETKEEEDQDAGTQTFVYTYLTRKSDGARLFANRNYQEAATGSFWLYEYGDESMENVARVVEITVKVYARYLLDVERISGLDTYPIPANDIVDNNRNYRRVIGYGVSNVVYYSSATTRTPTEWGIRQPGEYWQKPYALGISDFYPIGRTHWGDFSIWFAFSPSDRFLEESGRKKYLLKDAFPLHSVISVLLQQIAPGITHEPTTEYSQFLYDRINPISGDEFELFITQKSNILAGDYTQPAQKAPITLRMITDMLRDCFRAYWYVENGKFKIEHVQWFKNGGRYGGSPGISHDLTKELVTRNGKFWAFGTSQYDFNKATMPERYQFGWMDDVTRAFEGFPIDIISQYVTPGNIEEIHVSNFTTDIDYMLLNPGACSKDGFALMAAVPRQVVSGETSYNLLTVGAYSLRYSLGGLPAGENITVIFQTRGNPTGGLCGLAFLDASGNIVESIDSFAAGNYTQLTYTATIPEKATQIGFKQFTRTGTCEIRMISVQGSKELPFVQHSADGVEYINQNGLLAFIELQSLYYIYDMPAYQIRINNADRVAYGITREKKQTLRMPVVEDPNPLQLIRTFLGDGKIEKISVNLSSRNANVTLMFDTQNYNE